MKRIAICTLVLLAIAISAAIAGVPRGWYPLRFTMLSLSGRIYTDRDIAGGSTALVFWDSSSRLSRRLLDDLKTLQDRVGDDDLKVLTVHSDGRPLTTQHLGEIMTVAKASGLPFPVLLDWNGRARKSYRITEVPSVVVFDEEGRSNYNLEGYSLEQRDELAGSLYEILGRDRDTGRMVAVRSSRDIVREQGAMKEEKPSLCRIPRAYYCLISAEKGGAPSDPSVMAVRLSACRGDLENAERMMRGVSREKYLAGDLRFALGNMMIQKGEVEAAAAAFARLRESAPEEGWGSWGLGLSALAAGDEFAALRYMEEALAIDGGNAEAETAVLKYMETYWQKNRRAPWEDDFLNLFSDLASVRDCYRQAAGGRSGVSG
jgi:hypothetical protein